MNEIVARYEFRAFAQCLGMVAERLRQLSPCEGIEESIEAYLVSADMHDRNVKVRDGAIDIKRLVARRDGLEQWKPVVKQRFPISWEFVAEMLIPIFGSADVNFTTNREQFTAPELIDELFRPQSGIRVASVYKRRSRFTIAQCAAEMDQLLINGAAIQSVAVESEDPSAVASARNTLGMNDRENINYPLAIQRVLGLLPLPDDAWYGYSGDT